MVKLTKTGEASDYIPVPGDLGGKIPTELGTPAVTELIVTAIARIRADLEKYSPDRPAIAYALARETHAILLKQWRQHPPAVQAAILTEFLSAVAELLHQTQRLIELAVSQHGHIFGMREEALRLEILADITLEEVHRLESELAALR